MIYLFSATIILTLAYIIIDLKLLKGLNRLKTGTSTQKPPVSVIVSAKDESENIKECIESLLANQYHDFEILVANDRSTDDTPAILKELESAYTHKIRVLHINPEENSEGWSPKKFALNKLIEMSQHPIILTTDADCRVPPLWIDSMVKEFEDDVQFVVGFSYYEHIPKMNRLLFKLQALEFLSHMIVASGAIAIKFPITSSGTSLGYRKDWFYSVNGFSDVSQVLSGDDDLLLHKLSANAPQKVRFCPNPEGEVKTFPAKTVTELWYQRKRWASKTTKYTPQVVALLGTVFAFYLMICVWLIIGLYQQVVNGDSTPILLGLTFWIIKTIMDYSVMLKGTILFRRKELLSTFVPTAIFHIPLIVGAVLWGLAQPVTWNAPKK